MIVRYDAISEYASVAHCGPRMMREAPCVAHEGWMDRPGGAASWNVCGTRVTLCDT